MSVNVWTIQLRNEAGQWVDADVRISFSQTLAVYAGVAIAGEEARVMRNGHLIHPRPEDGELDLFGGAP